LVIYKKRSVFEEIIRQEFVEIRFTGDSKILNFED